MKNYIVYSLTSGMINRVGICPDRDLEAQAGPGEASMEGIADQLSEYIQEGLVVPRPPNPSSISGYSFLGDGVDSVTISDIPVGSTVSVDGVGQFAVDDGSFVLTSDVPREFLIRVSCAPYLDFEVTVSAT